MPPACTSCRASSTCTPTPVVFPKQPQADYVYKLWMGHGVTTTRDAGGGARDLVLSEKKRSAMVQLAVLDPKLALVDETDSGLDIDALRTVADGVNRRRRPDNAMVLWVDEKSQVQALERTQLVLPMMPGRPTGPAPTLPATTSRPGVETGERRRANEKTPPGTGGAR